MRSRRRKPTPSATSRAVLFGAVATVLLGTGACATNPVTGERELSFISEEQEIQMGRQSHEQVMASMGVVDDPELQAYVDDLGQRLARVSERPNLPWTFTVVDDATVNAFAIPGGFIYITRGMLTHLDSEAQLVGILGHEIGHVTARHSVNQMSRAQLANLGLGLGMIFVPELRGLGDLAGAGMQLMFLKFGRDDENQSDELGVQYMTQLGYEPAALSKVFGMLDEKTADARGSLPTWASTHPAPDDRQERILAMAENHPDARTVDRSDFLRQVDGLVFGDNPRLGYFEDNVFHHPDLAFRFGVPQGWNGMNGNQAVRIINPDQDAMMTLTFAPESGARAAAEAFASQQGIQVTDSGPGDVNGIPAYWLAFRARTESGELVGRAVFPELDGNVFAFYGVTPAQAWSARSRTIQAVLESFQRETDRSVLAKRPNVVDLVNLDRSLSLSQFMGSYQVDEDAETIALINQIWDTQQFSAGLQKRVVTR